MVEYVFSGLFATDRSWTHSTRIISNYEIIYVLHGEAYIRVGAEEYALGPGDLLVLPPEVEHGGYRESTGGVSFYWMHFLPRDGVSLHDLGLSTGFLRSKNHYSVAAYFKQLNHIAHNPAYAGFMVESAVLLLIGEVASLQKQADTPRDAVVYEIVEWIRLNSEKKCMVSDIAARFGYHPNYINRLFVRTFGISVKSYINQQRMNMIKHMLITTSLSIQEVSAQLGFESDNQLVHYFTYHEKISPSCFRKTYERTWWNNK